MALLAVPLTVAGLVLPGTAAWAWTCSDTVTITVQPTTTQLKTAMAPPVTVQVKQADGQVDQSYNGPVTLAYAVNPDGAPEPSGSTVKAVKGVATFSALTFSAVGFGFELQASISDGVTSPASAPFDVVSQLVHCSIGQACHSGTVSSGGTSASVTAAAAGTSDVLTATGGGFSLLSCTKHGGVVTVSVSDRSKVITLTLSKSQARSGDQEDRGSASQFGICWGSPTPFTTASGQAAAFNQANNEYEGLLPACSAYGPSPCVKKQTRHCNGPVTTTIDAPPGDPHITY